MPGSSPASSTGMRWLLGVPLLFIVAMFVMVSPKPAEGQQAFTPPSNPTSTTFDTFVRANWNAGVNNQFYCIDTAFNPQDLVSISGSWSNWGCGTTATSYDLDNLACDRLHYFRVWAAGPSGQSGYTDIGSFQSQSCGFAPPSNPLTVSAAQNGASLEWDRGQNNFFFCVDLAQNRSDLINLTGTWFNRDCGTTATMADIGGLACNTTYAWRVWSTNATTSGYSPIGSFHTAACDFGTQPVTIPGGGGTLLTDVRIGAHPDEGFDRIVFEFDGALPAETDIRYVGEAIRCGSGAPASVAGSGTLQIRMSSAAAHNEQGNQTVPNNIGGTGEAILEAKEICDFEGVVTWIVGIDDVSGFEVSTLSNPGRIVIDVQR